MNSYENKLTYKDFEIGEWVTLVKELYMNNGSQIGNSYEIIDLDYHFPNSICIRIINKEADNIIGFYNIEYFEPRIARREKKIDELLRDDKLGDV